MSDAVPTPAADAPGDPAAEHLAHLHKMSTTAGVTNLDYVAVNQAAVVAAVLGVLSSLAFFSPLLLVIPLIAIAFAIAGLRQIADSAGTQTGKLLAIAGIVLSVALGGAAAARDLSANWATGGDAAAIASTLSDVQRLVRDNKYPEAYELFDQDFRARVTPKQFEAAWRAMQGEKPPGLGPLETFAWNGVTPEFGSAGGARIAGLVARIKFARSNEERIDVIVRQVGNRWLINSVPFFPRERGRGDRDPFDLPAGF